MLTPVPLPSNSSPFVPAQSIQLSPTEPPDFAGGHPPLDVVLESFKNSITQQWQSLVNSYFPTHTPTSAPDPRIQSLAPHQTPAFHNSPTRSLLTRTQPTKRRYSEFQEQGEAVAYSASPKQYSTGSVQRLRVKSPLDTPSLWAVPEVRPVGRPRGRPRGDAVPEVRPVGRPRGRPRGDAVFEVRPVGRPRGRPRGDAVFEVRPVGRPRGRPRGDAVPEIRPVGRPRGRPRGDAIPEVRPVGRPRGRPRGNAVPEIRPVGRPRGRPRGDQRLHFVPSRSAMEARRPHSLSPRRRQLSTASQSDGDEYELTTDDNTDSDPEELKQESDDYETPRNEAGIPDRGVETLSNDAGPSGREYQGPAPTPPRDNLPDMTLQAVERREQLEDADDDIDLIGHPQPSPSPLRISFVTSVRDVESPSMQISNTAREPLIATPMSKRRLHQERIDSHREPIKDRMCNRGFLVQSRQDSVDNAEETTSMPSPVTMSAGHRQLYSSDGATVIERIKKPRALFIQALPSPKLRPSEDSRARAAFAVPAAERPKAQHISPNAPVAHQKANNVSSNQRQTPERRKSDSGVFYISSSTQKEPIQTYRSHPHAEMRKPDTPRNGQNHPTSDTQAGPDQLPPRRGRGRPRKSDPGVQKAVEESSPEATGGFRLRAPRARKSDYELSYKLQDPTNTLQSRHHGRPYTSPWDLEDDMRLIDMVMVQKLSLQKAYSSNLFPGKTLPALVHRYYRVLGAPVRQVRQSSNPPMICENCHVEYIPSKRVKSIVDTLCIVCQLYAKAHGGKKRTFESDGITTALDEPR
jgi:hypothetical protein